VPAVQEYPESNAAMTVAPVFDPGTLPAGQRLKAAFSTAFPKVEMTFKDQKYRFSPAGLREAGGQWILISTASGEDCHGCGGLLGITYLKPGESGFEVSGNWPDLIPGGSFGQPPAWNLREDLMSMPVIIASGGGTFQGYTCETSTMVALTPSTPTIVADGIPTAYSNDGTMEAEQNGKADSVKGRIGPDTKDKSFRIIYTGTAPGTVRYVRSGAQFTPSAGSYQPPTC
jgi:hypothetical protein